MKRIKDIFEIEEGNIVSMAKNKQVDTIVNSANPSLMKGQGLDECIHEAINSHLHSEDFNKKIREELDGGNLWNENIIRCTEGNVVRTSGYSLCTNIIHTVGPYYDKTNSSVQTLENCYRNILKIAFERPDVRKIAIPVISAKSKDFKYKKAVDIAVISINNYLINVKRRNCQALQNIDKIYLVLYQPQESIDVYKKKYKEIIQEEKLAHYRKFIEAQISYLYEIKINDTSKRGYFAIAKFFRYFLVFSRFLYLPSMVIRQFMRKKGWETGKKWIEIEIIIQLFMPVIAFGLINRGNILKLPISEKCLAIAIVSYTLFDIVTYLLGLMFLSDIQRPSANPIRSILLIIINYMTSILCVAVLFYWKFPEQGEWKAIDFALLGERDVVMLEATEHLIVYLQEGIQFFFMTLIFAFFMGHLKQRRFQ